MTRTIEQNIAGSIISVKWCVKQLTEGGAVVLKKEMEVVNEEFHLSGSCSVFFVSPRALVSLVHLLNIQERILCHCISLEFYE